ncbi:hypothetical protein [Marinobacter sp. P4B1]|uniref:hypothetical protein n=1 Tax=Marinobacter sp. P4B1 TaxID=1119533 RepID=UPI00071C6A3D|nr:hypothetical protein [Marinobacter sp. P4B1]KRW83733.1 hypothetical protein AQ621_16930 [Marinobacter sp. P4B1]
MHKIINQEYNAKLFSKAVKESQTSSFRAECKMAFPTIDGILMRAAALLCVQEREGEPYLHYVLREMRASYRSGNDLWFERKITMRVFYELLLKEIKRHTLLGACYEIALGNGQIWSYPAHGPLLNWVDDIRSVSSGPIVKWVSDEDAQQIMGFLLEEDDLRMLDVPVKQKLKGVEA